MKRSRTDVLSKGTMFALDVGISFGSVRQPIRHVSLTNRTGMKKNIAKAGKDAMKHP
jgi:hypothetical protein